MAEKIVWMYWHQGWEKAPLLVRRCADSWAALNQDWKVRLLDWNSAADFVSLPKEINSGRKDLPLQKISNILRLALLRNHGGAWADATLYCRRPLSEWLPEYSAADFFAFRNPGPDRLISTWFIAAEPDSVILQRLYTRLLSFFTHNTFSNQGTSLGRSLLVFFSRRWNADYRTTRSWDSWFARRVLRVYPYYIFHYLFNKLILTDGECAAAWNRCKPFPSLPIMSLKHLEREADGLARAGREIESGLEPMYKLDWRVDSTNRYWTAVFGLLSGTSVPESPGGPCAGSPPSPPPFDRAGPPGSGSHLSAAT